MAERAGPPVCPSMIVGYFNLPVQAVIAIYIDKFFLFHFTPNTPTHWGEAILKDIEEEEMERKKKEEKKKVSWIILEDRRIGNWVSLGTGTWDRKIIIGACISLFSCYFPGAFNRASEGELLACAS
jgi:hypothetical protein